MDARRRTIAAIAFAIVLSACHARAVSLESLFQGGSIAVGDKVFEGFDLIGSPLSSNGGFVNLANIEVTPLADDPFTPGIRYTAGFSDFGTPFGHAGGAGVQLGFVFTVRAIDGGRLIKDSSLFLNDFVFDSGPNASIRIDEIVRDASDVVLGSKSVLVANDGQSGSGAASLFDSADFFPESVVFVETTIDISGPGQNDGVRLLMFEQRFSQIPEPGTLALIAFGVSAVACLRSGRRRC